MWHGGCCGGGSEACFPSSDPDSRAFCSGALWSPGALPSWPGLPASPSDGFLVSGDSHVGEVSTVFRLCRRGGKSATLGYAEF